MYYRNSYSRYQKAVTGNTEIAPGYTVDDMLNDVPQLEKIYSILKDVPGLESQAAWCLSLITDIKNGLSYSVAKSANKQVAQIPKNILAKIGKLAKASLNMFKLVPAYRVIDENLKASQSPSFIEDALGKYLIYWQSGLINNALNQYDKVEQPTLEDAELFFNTVFKNQHDAFDRIYNVLVNKIEPMMNTEYDASDMIARWMIVSKNFEARILKKQIISKTDAIKYANLTKNIIHESFLIRNQLKFVSLIKFWSEPAKILEVL